jgi:hypothetical protein
MARGAWTLIAAMALTAACFAAGADEPSAKTVPLFNGANLDGWDYHLVDPKVTMGDVWRVEDGVLICKGEPLGYLATKESFKNFKLTLEWRWAPGKKPGNSGVLMRISGKPIGFMPKCLEAQLQHGRAGDLWAFRGFHVRGPEDRSRKVENNKQLGDFVGVAKAGGVEKEPGQWNQYAITFNGDKVSVAVNGETVNEGTGCDVVAGPIGLQSEGGEIHFRNVKLTRIEE